MEKIWPPDPNKPRAEYKPSQFISEWNSVEQKVITKDRATYYADKYRAADKQALRYFAFAVLAGFAALLCLGLFLGEQSVSKTACRVVSTVYNSGSEDDEENMTGEQRKQREAVERAFEKCQNNGVFD